MYANNVYSACLPLIFKEGKSAKTTKICIKRDTLATIGRKIYSSLLEDFMVLAGRLVTEAAACLARASCMIVMCNKIEVNISDRMNKKR